MREVTIKVLNISAKIVAAYLLLIYSLSILWFIDYFSGEAIFDIIAIIAMVICLVDNLIIRRKSKIVNAIALIIILEPVAIICYRILSNRVDMAIDQLVIRIGMLLFVVSFHFTKFWLASRSKSS